MPYKNPEDKKAWRKRYHSKQLGYQRDWNRRQSEKTRPMREAAKAEREALKEHRENMAALKWTMGYVKQWIMDRDRLRKCTRCKKIIPNEKFSASRLKRTSGECKKCSGKVVREWKRKNPSAVKAMAQRHNARTRLDPVLLCQTRIRQAMQKAIKRFGKGEIVAGGKLRYLGCTAKKACAYIEQQFKDGMTWENYGTWQIDHVHPVASFDLSKESERRTAFHYTNLQPLWAKENMRKNDRILNREHQALLTLTPAVGSWKR